MDLSRNNIIDIIQSKVESIDEFDFDKLSAPPLYSLLTVQDIDSLYRIATSIRYSGNPRLKFKAISDILKPRGFVKLSGGTNRVVYRFLEDDRFVIKVAIDNTGIEDTPKEFINQAIFKPFVTKVFEVDPTGTVGVFERVDPITSREEFLSVAPEIYDLITKWFTGKYVMADIGSLFFMNYGIRKGFRGKGTFGPVLLDFPYVYELDGNKLFCNAYDETAQNHICGGEIDYDEGFNYLRCTKCGQEYRVKEIAKKVDSGSIITIGHDNRRKRKMKVAVVKYGTKISTADDDGMKAATQKIELSPVREDTAKSGTLRASIKSIKSEKEIPVDEDEANRGVVRSTASYVSPTYLTDSIKASNSSAKGKQSIKEMVKAELANKTFGLDEYDAEHHLMFLICGDYKVNFNVDTIDPDTTNLIAENSDHVADIINTKDFVIDKYKAQVADLQSELDRIKESNNSDIKAELDQLKIDYATENKKHKEYVESQRKAQLEYSSAKDALGAVNEDYTKLQDQYHDITEELSNAQASIIQQESKIVDLNALVNELMCTNTYLEKNQKDADAEAALEEMLSNKDSEITTLSERCEELKDEVVDLKSKLIAAEVMDTEPGELLDVTAIDGCDCIDAVVTTINALIDSQNLAVEKLDSDHKAIVICSGDTTEDGKDLYCKDPDGNTIVITSIGSIPLDELRIIKKKPEVVPQEG